MQRESGVRGGYTRVFVRLRLRCAGYESVGGGFGGYQRVFKRSRKICMKMERWGMKSLCDGDVCS
jgi:hypothetical protein